MAQRKSTLPPPADAAPERVGPYALAGLLRRDRMGTVHRGEGPDSEVRIRICPALEDSEPLTAVLDRLAAVAHPAIARVLDQFVDDAGRVAVVTPLDHSTLADRHRAGRLDVRSLSALGCVLLDGLAALHSAGLGHGAISPAAVGIDAEGSARWQDAAVLPVLSRSRMQASLRMASDVADCAAMLRDLGRLPPQLEAVVDPVAAGVPGAIERAAPLAAAWREAMAGLDLPVPPEGVRARIPGLLPAAPGTQKRRARRLPLPRWTRPAAAGALLAVAMAIVPVAALGPGGGPLSDRIDAYAPLAKGLRLTYRLESSGISLTVTLRVTESRVIAGTLTATLQLESDVGVQAGRAGLPLGLGGTTIRIQPEAVVRTVSGGAVRDLLNPLAPGTAWRDRRTGVVSDQVIDERRSVLGPVSLDTRAGHYDRCLAVALTSHTTVAGAPGSSGAGTLWYCPGVGLAKAVLTASGQRLDIDLVSAR